MDSAMSMNRNGISKCSFYHLVGPVSPVDAVAPMNGFVAAATLKYVILVIVILIIK